MSRTLKQLYEGNIAPQERDLSHIPKYSEAEHVVVECEQTLHAELPDTHKKTLERISDACLERTMIIAQESFKDGYRLATKLLIEALYT